MKIGSRGKEFFMGEGQVIQEIRLRLLAFVLTMALIWYTMNPAPGPVRQVKRDEGQPDEQRRGATSPTMEDYDFGGAEGVAMKSAVDLSMAEVEVLEWPEVIDIT